MKKVSVLLLCVLTAFAGCVFVPPASEVDASQKSAKNLAVVMYHNTVPDNYKASVYVIRAGSLERDLKFLKEKVIVFSALPSSSTVSKTVSLCPKKALC